MLELDQAPVTPAVELTKYGLGVDLTGTRLNSVRVVGFTGRSTRKAKPATDGS